MRRAPEHLSARVVDLGCVGLLLAATLAVYAPALFGGKVLLPADIVPLMRPWAVTARERFPDFRFAQNQMHGPIFEYYSWRHYARERIRAGEVPLWNPYELGGNVLLANSQSAVLYPPNLLLYLFALPTGLNLVTALHTFLTGFFLFGLLRALRLRPAAALTGALVWMFCGLQVVWTEFQTPTAALCWLPGALWAWERYAQGGGWRWGVFGAGGAVAMTLLAGHLHFAFYVLLAFVLYAVWRSVSRCSGVQAFRRSGHPFLVLGGALAFGLLLSMATMLPVLEMGRMNHRAGKTEYAASVSLRLPPENLFTLLLPNLLGNPRDYVSFDASGNPQPGGNSYWGKFDFIEYTSYVGIPALILAMFGMGHRTPNTQRRTPNLLWFFVLLALLGLLLALGTPVCALFFYGVPGYRQFNATARALCLLSFALAVLAAFGVERLMRAAEEQESRRAGRLAVGVVGAVVLAGLVAFPGMGLAWKVQDSTGREVSRLFTDQWFSYELAGLRHFLLFAALTGAALWLLLRSRESRVEGRTRPDSRLPTLDSRLPWLLPLIAVSDLLIWGAGFNPMTDPAMLGYPTETTDFLRTVSPDRVVSLEAPGKGNKSLIVPNYNAVVGLREAQGADSIHTRRYHQMIERVVLAMEPGRGAAFPEPNTIRLPGVAHPVLDLLNIRYVTTLPEHPLDAARFRRVRDAELTIWENPRALGRAWVVGAAERIQGLEEAFARLSAPDFDPRQIALLETDAPPLDASAAGSPATLTTFSPHRVTVDVEARGRGLLILSEIAFPGWRATVDGRPAPVYTANYLLRAVAIPPGRHTVVLTYEPASYRLGLYLSALALGFLAAALACRSRRDKPE